MILPSKHIRLSESLFGLGAFILSKVDRPKTLDELWKEFENSVKTGRYPFSHSFENFILAIDLLHMLGGVATDKYGRIILCNS